jgi:hypothetical protein
MFAPRHPSRRQRNAAVGVLRAATLRSRAGRDNGSTRKEIAE